MNPLDPTTPDTNRAQAPSTGRAAAPGLEASPGPADPSDPQRGSGRRGLRTVIAACLLSATLASVSTSALVAMALGGSQPSTVAPTPNAIVTGTDSEPVDLADVVAVARKSVVTITANGVSRGTSRFSVPATGVGSGLVITADGYILTNGHVVNGSASLTVALPDGREFPATIVRELDDNDLALIKIEASDLDVATIGDSTTLKVGQTAIAIGSPLGTYTETVTRGIISATGRDITVTDEGTGRPTELHDLIQTDAAINPGNSGGPLLDAAGAVVGISTAVAASSEGLGFAIPIDATAELIALARD